MKSKFFFIEEKNLEQFIFVLLSKYDVVAPIKKGDVSVFDSIKSFGDIDLNFINTTFPPKKYFLPNDEKILEYKLNDISSSYEEKKRIIFGIRPCDVHSILHQEKIFLDSNFLDLYYYKRRENTLIFALNCSESGENCFCNSLGTDKLTSGFDLLFSKVSDGYVVEIGSEKGNEILINAKKFFKEANGKENEIKSIICKKSLSEKEIEKLENSFNSKIWEKYSEKCLSCCACTITCPNCLCFGLRDLINLDLKSGERIREWQSCQLKVFTKVAGEYVFRNERYKRFRHRIYHQLNYFKKQYGVHFCVGCGRCISNCPTKIDMTEIIKEL
ncbi:MAG: 4Fe-4S dicluster domain-containing protein [Candidatus Altiarchaeota archaeon]